MHSKVYDGVSCVTKSGLLIVNVDCTCKVTCILLRNGNSIDLVIDETTTNDKFATGVASGDRPYTILKVPPHRVDKFVWDITC